MRRANKEISVESEKLGVLEKCRVCRLAMSLDETPYVVPMNFGFEYAEGRLTLFFHCAKEGRKIDILRKNPLACFEADTGHRLIEGDYACGYSFAFESLIGSGKITFVEENEAKKAGLDAIMRAQTGKPGPFTYSEEALDKTTVLRLDVDEWTGKRRTT